jgi:hypothetical protein
MSANPCRIRISDLLKFTPDKDPVDPGDNKASDPGSGSAILQSRTFFLNSLVNSRRPELGARAGAVLQCVVELMMNEVVFFKLKSFNKTDL